MINHTSIDFHNDRLREIKVILSKLSPHEHTDGMNECHICDQGLDEAILIELQKISTRAPSVSDLPGGGEAWWNVRENDGPGFSYGDQRTGWIICDGRKLNETPIAVSHCYKFAASHNATLSVPPQTELANTVQGQMWTVEEEPDRYFIRVNRKRMIWLLKWDFGNVDAKAVLQAVADAHNATLSAPAGDVKGWDTERSLAVCSECGRKTWSAMELGCRCEMPQPSGLRCQGTLTWIDVAMSTEREEKKDLEE